MGTGRRIWTSRSERLTGQTARTPWRRVLGRLDDARMHWGPGGPFVPARPVAGRPRPALGKGGGLSATCWSSYVASSIAAGLAESCASPSGHDIADDAQRLTGGSPHPCRSNGVARPAQRLASTALSRRSLIRMKSEVQVLAGPPQRHDQRKRFDSSRREARGRIPLRDEALRTSSC